MKVLIIGSGGREHALAWKCAQTADEVLVAPGNAGTAREDKVRNVPVSSDDIDNLVKLAKSEKVNLTIVGPEAPLVAGIVDRFIEENLPCFGPSAAAAQLEGSKAFSKDFLARHHIPTAAYRNFSTVKKRASSSLPTAKRFFRSRRRRTTRPVTRATRVRIRAAWAHTRPHPLSHQRSKRGSCTK
jgi:phosphoribosylamine-glycine ligase